VNWWLALLNMVGMPVPTVTVTVHQASVLLTVSVGSPAVRSGLTAVDRSLTGCWVVVVPQAANRTQEAMSVKRMGRTLCHSPRMINGGHVIVYSKKSEADRAFFRDV